MVPYSEPFLINHWLFKTPRKDRCLTQIATSLLPNLQRESLFEPLPNEPDDEPPR